MQGRSDPREVGERFLSLARAEKGRAAMYRQWERESVTEIERMKWRHAAEQQEDAAEFNNQRGMEYLGSVIDARH